jgi:hypothetical protein
MACIEALSPAPSARTRMQISRAVDHLVDQRRVSDSAWARASAGRAGDQLERLPAGARGLAVLALAELCASRWASRRSCRAMREPSSGERRRRLEPAGLGVRLRRASAAASASARRRRRRRPPSSLAAAWAGALRRRGQRAAVEQGEVAVLRAPAHPRQAERADRRHLGGVVMRKLLSGNGCDIQPTSRWTNIPTRSAWTSISGVMVLVAAFMDGRPAERRQAGLAVLSASRAGLEPPRRRAGAALN